MSRLALAAIRVYQRGFSQFRPATCRFVPSCSQYGYEAIGKFGLLKGGWLIVRRLVRCNPFNPGGVDPVP